MANDRRGTFDALGDTHEDLGEIPESSLEWVQLETVIVQRRRAG